MERTLDNIIGDLNKGLDRLKEDEKMLPIVNYMEENSNAMRSFLSYLGRVYTKSSYDAAKKGLRAYANRRIYFVPTGVYFGSLAGAYVIQGGLSLLGTLGSITLSMLSFWGVDKLIDRRRENYIRDAVAYILSNDNLKERLLKFYKNTNI